MSLTIFLKEQTEGDNLIYNGGSFQNLGAAHLKLRSPYVLSFELGTCNNILSVERRFIFVK